MNDVTAKSLLIELQCTNKDITEAQNDALSYVISFLDEIISEVDKGVALPNTIDNGDKIDGYDYIYKTDSEGVPYINIDSVRAMLTKAANVQLGNKPSPEFPIYPVIDAIPVEEDYQKSVEGLRKYAKSSPNLLEREGEEE